MRNNNPSSLSERFFFASLKRQERPLIGLVAGMLSKSPAAVECGAETLERVRAAVECLNACLVELAARQCEDVVQGVGLPANHARPARAFPFIDELRELLYLAEEIARERSYLAHKEAGHE